MKLQFEKSDSFYKIFKSIEKLPDNKKVNISIHPQNQFFRNVWRGKQLVELFQQKNIEYTITTNDQTVVNYFEELWVPVELNKENKFRKRGGLMYDFFFRIKDFQLQMLNKKDYVSFIILGLESIIVLICLYLVYVILVPTASVYITPTYNVEEVAYNFRYYPSAEKAFSADNKFISVPYYKASIDYKYNFSTPLQQLDINIQNASWFVKFTSNLNADVSLKPNTKLITKDGVIFQTQWWVKVPSAGREVIVPVSAIERDDEDGIIGARGNIVVGTQMEVKNLQWNLRDAIKVVSTTNFSGGKFFTDGLITSGDIANFISKASVEFDKQKKDILMKNLNNNTIKPFYFDDMIWYSIQNYTTSKKIWEKANIVDGVMDMKITYAFVYWDDLISAITKYSEQRPNQSFNLQDIDRNSLILYERYSVWTGIYVIPTKANTIRWYNFDTDIADVKSQIKDRIKGQDLPTAQKLLLTIPSVWSAKVRISPLWYNKVTDVDSRINIKIVKPTE